MNQRGADIKPLRQAGQRLAAHERGAQARQLAFGGRGEATVQVFRQHEVQHGIAQVLQPLVVLPVQVGMFVQVGAVGQGGAQERRIAEGEAVAQGKLLQDFGRVGHRVLRSDDCAELDGASITRGTGFVIPGRLMYNQHRIRCIHPSRHRSGVFVAWRRDEE